MLKDKTVIDQLRALIKQAKTVVEYFGILHWLALEVALAMEDADTPWENLPLPNSDFGEHASWHVV